MNGRKIYVIVTERDYELACARVDRLSDLRQEHTQEFADLVDAIEEYEEGAHS